MGQGYLITKRALDFLAAVVGLILLGWLLLLIYILVRVTSPGSGFFVQARSGRAGKLFGLIKFRTMRADHVHDPDPSVVITTEHSAVTGVGRLLRKFKLDEAPQLFNVLAGQMSLVGPRPTVPEQVAEYDDFKRQRLIAPPGVTGLAQINGGTGLTWDERIEWDVYYVHTRSLWGDLRILLATPVAMLTGTDKNPRRFREVHPDWDGPSPL